MPGWLALSDSASTGAAPALMERGLFVVEFALPLDGPTVLFARTTEKGWTRNLSLFADPEGGLTLLHRQGEAAQHHRLPGSLPELRGTARLSFTFDAPAQIWRMALEVTGLPEHNRSINGIGCLPMNVADLRALALSSERHPALLWFGASAGMTLPPRAPWIGLRTRIDTRRGVVEAGDLCSGDLVATLDHGFLPLRALQRNRYPARGSFAPILLRSPYFGLSGDIVVSSDQLVLISGASVEYLCGVEEALAPARALCDGTVAEREERRAVAEGLSLDLGRPALIVADGCCLLSACDPDEDLLPRHALAPFEMPPLLALLGRTALRHMA